MSGRLEVILTSFFVQKSDTSNKMTDFRHFGFGADSSNAPPRLNFLSFDCLAPCAS